MRDGLLTGDRVPRNLNRHMINRKEGEMLKMEEERDGRW